MAQALYERLENETWCDEKPDNLKSVWVDGDVDFYILAAEAIAVVRQWDAGK